MARDRLAVGQVPKPLAVRPDDPRVSSSVDEIGLEHDRLAVGRPVGIARVHVPRRDLAKLASVDADDEQRRGLGDLRAVRRGVRVPEPREDELAAVRREACRAVEVGVLRQHGHPPQMPTILGVHEVDALLRRIVAAVGLQGDRAAVRRVGGVTAEADAAGQVPDVRSVGAHRVHVVDHDVIAGIRVVAVGVEGDAARRPGTRQASRWSRRDS